MTQGEIQKNLPPQPTSQLSSVFQPIKKQEKQPNVKSAA